MATWLKPTRNTTTLTAQSRNTATWVEQAMMGVVSFITTNAPDYILVGSAEDEYLVWQDAGIWGKQTRN